MTDNNKLQTALLIAAGIEASNNTDISIADAEDVMEAMQHVCDNQPDDPKIADTIAKIRNGFAYWKNKFDRLIKATDKVTDEIKSDKWTGYPSLATVKLVRDTIKQLAREFIHTDEQRDIYAQSAYNIVQIGMKIFINVSRNVLWNLPRFYRNPKLAMEEACGSRTKFDIMHELMDELAKEYGYENAEAHINAKGI
jgi:hypothetical protein